MINVFGRTLRPPSTLTRLVVLAAFSVLLMILDHRGHHLEKIRSGLTILTYPIHYVAGLPARVGGAIADFFTGERALRETNESLRHERLMLLGKLQQFETLEQENNRLRLLLGSSTRVADKALAADLIEVSAEPFTRTILLSRGSQDGVYIGQPVIDAYGIIGQITRVTGITSRATLLTDPGHAIPVQVNRNGLRALVFGTGAADTLKVPYLTAAADIRPGDLLMSSGLGGTFPPGYPVAQVLKIVNDPDEAFLEISAKPAAQINHSKRLLLIWPGNLTPAPPPKPAAPKDAKKGATK
jgi:rod shape-determining protein MreC